MLNKAHNSCEQTWSLKTFQISEILVDLGNLPWKYTFKFLLI